MVSDPNDLPPGSQRPARRSNALRIGWTLLFVGMALLIVPLIGAFLSLGPTDDAIARIEWILAFMPIFLFFSALFLAFGLTMLFTQAVDYSASGKGKAKVFGVDLPVQFRGGAMILLVLLIGIFLGMERFGLNQLVEEWGEWTELNSKVHEGELEVKRLEGQLSESQRVRKHFANAFIARSSGQAQSMIVRLRCDRNDADRTVRWKDFRDDEKRGIILAGGNYGQETSTELPPDAHLLEGSDRVIYTIETADSVTGKSRLVISSQFELKDGILIATIWPNAMSLFDLCWDQTDEAEASYRHDGQSRSPQTGEIQDQDDDWQNVAERKTDQ